MHEMFVRYFLVLLTFGTCNVMNRVVENKMRELVELVVRF